ncbi:MAG: NAD(+)/NADH kinase [Clostridia bacterium]|nr:NAD(+)/NADH kinase [Clostridia bacterium]
MKKAIIIPNYLKTESIEFSKKATEILEKKGYKVTVLGEEEEPKQGASFALVLGGDGTLLRACKKLYKLNIPMMGINFGHIGYLTECNPDMALEAIESIINGEYKLEKRLMLEGSVIRGENEVYSFVALNEATLFRSTHKKAFTMDVYINGMHTQTVLGDGLIVATPTGSTSYNLSAGGPVLTPTSSSIVLTPVSPLQFLRTSLVIDGGDEIEIKVKINSPVRNKKVTIEIDGDDSFDIRDGDIIKIKRSKSTAQTIRVNDISFYQILKSKLSSAGI